MIGTCAQADHVQDRLKNDSLTGTDSKRFARITKIWLIRLKEIVSFLIHDKVSKPSLSYIAVLCRDVLTDLFREIPDDFLRIRRV